MRSAFYWFAEFCHSQCLSHFAASFIVTWAETSIAKSCEIDENLKNRKLLKKKNIGAKPTAMRQPQDALGFPSENGRPQSIEGWVVWIRIIDPSAGSPTETLLRLLLPLSNKVNLTFQSLNELPRQGSVRNIHRIAQSVGATGGVYKGQGRNHDELMIHHY